MKKKHFFALLIFSFYFFSAFSTDFFWGVDSNGNWNTTTNWSPNGLPNGFDDTVTFGATISVPRAVDLQNFTFSVESATFDNANAYTLQGDGPVSGVLDITGSSSITVLQGSHTMNTRVNVDTNSGTGNFTTAGNLTLTRGVFNPGTLVKLGGGTLTFEGTNPGEDNTISVLQVDAGTLILNKSGGLVGAGPAVDINGGELRLAAGNQMADGTDMSLNGGIFNLQTNTETLKSLAFSGGSVLGTGTLELSSNSGNALNMKGGASIPLQVNLTGTTGGSVAFTGASGTATLNALDLGNVVRSFNIANGSASIDMNIVDDVSGSGGIVKTGAGTLELSGSAANTYTGQTTVLSGTLFLNKDAGLSAVLGPLQINGGTVQFGANADQLGSNSHVTLNTGGTMNLAGASQAMGRLTYNGGTLNQGATAISLGSTGTALTMRNVTISGQVNLTGGSGGTIIFDNANNGTATIQALDLGNVNRTIIVPASSADFGMVINGGSSSGGGFNKQGAGALRLSGTHDYTGSSSAVLAGRLAVDDTLTTGTLAIASGAILSGTGTINSNVTVEGTIQPGASIGTISLVGNQIFGSTSTTEIEVSQTEADLIDITGSLTIQPGAALTLVPVGTFSSPNTYTIIQTSGGITGEFSSVNHPFLTIEALVTYDGDNVILELVHEPFTSEVNSGNPGAVAAYLDTLDPPPGSDLNNVLGVIRTIFDPDQLRDVLNQLHPAMYKAFALT